MARDSFNPDTTAADVEQGFAKWERAVATPIQNEGMQGDSPPNTYSHGQLQLPALLGARVPLFIGYGTRDATVVTNDYLRIEAIQLQKPNLTFRAYIGRERNFFGFKDGKDGQVNFDGSY